MSLILGGSFGRLKGFRNQVFLGTTRGRANTSPVVSDGEFRKFSVLTPKRVAGIWNVKVIFRGVAQR
jgi:hypothetical protein